MSVELTHISYSYKHEGNLCVFLEVLKLTIRMCQNFMTALEIILKVQMFTGILI